MIKAVFRAGEESLRVSGLWQWDYGQTLEIAGLENITKAITKAEVHFALENAPLAEIGTAQIQPNGTLCAKIPDKMLESGRGIRAYVYIADADHGKTVRTVHMPVSQRPKPEDYNSTPAEKNLIRQMMETLSKKADGINLSEDGWLQLMSGDNGIGSRVRLPSGNAGEIELRNTGTDIEWRYTNSNAWTSLISLESLRGPAGETPEFEVRDGHLIAIYND